MGAIPRRPALVRKQGPTPCYERARLQLCRASQKERALAPELRRYEPSAKLSVPPEGQIAFSTHDGLAGLDHLRALRRLLVLGALLR